MKQTPVSTSLVARITEAARYVLSGNAPAVWFGAGEPMKPQAPAEVEGRRFDYPVGINIGTGQRTQEPVTFDDLRALADNCDILRSVIETRKDQMEALDWTVRPRDAHASPEVMKAAQQVQEFLQYPDGEHSFSQWMRQILEDMFVIDAAAIYKRRNRAGGIYALEIIDGGSIRLLLDDSGCTPQTPEPAYQQILKGIPAVDYTREELVYIQHNPRSYKIYGYSHVEQVLVTVNILIRRALHQLEYYREGSQPDALIGLPKEWSQDQIVTFQKHFDALLSGNSALRRHVRFMPGDFKYQETKAPPLKDAYDEFLARIICYVFSISPEPFVGQVNRATAESSQARAIAEGLAPLQKHMRSLMNRIIQRDMGFTELEFAWQDTRQQDPREAAQIDVAYVSAGILTADEVRDKMGLKKLNGGNASAEDADVKKFNPHHDERGRFTSEGNAVAPGYRELPGTSPKGSSRSSSDNKLPKLTTEQRQALDVLGISENNLPSLIEQAKSGNEVQTAFAGIMGGAAFLTLLVAVGILHTAYQVQHHAPRGGMILQDEIPTSEDEKATKKPEDGTEQAKEKEASSQSTDEILAPDGKPIGKSRNWSGVREVEEGYKGKVGAAGAEELFNDLTKGKGGKDVTPDNYDGTMIELPNGDIVGIRHESKSGPATIDINTGKNKKYKFP